MWVEGRVWRRKAGDALIISSSKRRTACVNVFSSTDGHRLNTCFLFFWSENRQKNQEKNNKKQKRQYFYIFFKPRLARPDVLCLKWLFVLIMREDERENCDEVKLFLFAPMFIFKLIIILIVRAKTSGWGLLQIESHAVSNCNTCLHCQAIVLAQRNAKPENRISLKPRKRFQLHLP